MQHKYYLLGWTVGCFVHDLVGLFVGHNVPTYGLVAVFAVAFNIGDIVGYLDGLLPDLMIRYLVGVLDGFNVFIVDVCVGLNVVIIDGFIVGDVVGIIVDKIVGYYDGSCGEANDEIVGVFDENVGLI